MISKTKLPGFYKKFDVVSVFIENAGEILLLLRQDHKPQGNTWGMPAGKVKHGEALLDALVREVREEIGLRIYRQECKYSEGYYVRYTDYDFLYHVYHLFVPEKPTLNINMNEHKDYRWVKPVEALKLDLIQDEDFVVKWCYGV